jgi:hypothetical protein
MGPGPPRTRIDQREVGPQRNPRTTPDPWEGVDLVHEARVRLEAARRMVDRADSGDDPDPYELAVYAAVLLEQASRLIALARRARMHVVP